MKKVLKSNSAGKAVITKYSVSSRQGRSIRKNAAGSSALSQGQRSTIARAKAKTRGSASRG